MQRPHLLHACFWPTKPGTGTPGRSVLPVLAGLPMLNPFLCLRAAPASSGGTSTLDVIEAMTFRVLASHARCGLPFASQEPWAATYIIAPRTTCLQNFHDLVFAHRWSWPLDESSHPNAQRLSQRMDHHTPTRPTSCYPLHRIDPEQRYPILMGNNRSQRRKNERMCCCGVDPVGYRTLPLAIVSQGDQETRA